MGAMRRSQQRGSEAQRLLAAGREIEKLKRRFLEIPDPSGGGGVLSWSALDLDTEGNGHISEYSFAPPEFATDDNFVYLRGTLQLTNAFDPDNDFIIVPGGKPAPDDIRRMPLSWATASGHPLRLLWPTIGPAGANGRLSFAYDGDQGGWPTGWFSRAFLDGLSYSR